MRRGRRLSLARPGSLLLAFGVVAAATLPSAGGCKGREDQLRNCDVQALFQSSCDGSQCHGSDTPRAGLDLVSPGVDQRLFHVAGSNDCDNRKLVFPGHPEDSLLYIKITEKKPFCGKRMPIGQELSDSEIACVRQYIDTAGINTDVTTCETCGTILCVDFDRDPRHCGGCDMPCDEGKICAGATCIDQCNAGETVCGSSCATVDNDNDNCGKCGHRCGPGSSCQQGVCACSNGDGMGGGGGMSGVAEVPSFQDDILPIFENSCSGNDCHTETDREAPLGLDPADAYSNLVGTSSENCGAKTLVVPGSPDQSYLVDKLMGGSICDGDQMPLDEDPLPPAGVRTFVNWICAGAPDN